jgi:nucleoside-diphosphate-sugar epimerase
MQKTVLVTGASGFIGRHVIQPLLELGFVVHGVSSGGVGQLQEISTDCHWHQVDLLDPLPIKDLMAIVRPSHLLHLAWYAVPGRYWQAPENFAWVQASLELVRQFQVQGGQRLVVAGSCAEYDWRYGYCQEELTPKLPNSPYGICKNSLRLLLESYCQLTGLSMAWGRIFFLYGSHEPPSRLVAGTIRSMLRGEVARCSHGNQIRDFLHVADAAAAFGQLLAGEVPGAVNIASGVPVRLREILEMLADRLQAEHLLELGAIPAAPNDVPLLMADVTRIQQEVGWQPHWSIDRGLAQTIDWYRKQMVETG